MTKINFTNISEDILWKIIRINVKAVNVKANELRVKAVNVKANELRGTNEKAKMITNLIIDRYHKTMLLIWNSDFCHTKYTSYSHQMLKKNMYAAANRELAYHATGGLTDYAWVGNLMKSHLGRIIHILETTWNALNNYEQWFAEFNGNKETKDGI